MDMNLEVKSFFNNMPKKTTVPEIGSKVPSDSFQSKYSDMSGTDSAAGRLPIRTECDAIKIFNRYFILYLSVIPLMSFPDTILMSTAWMNTN